LGNSQMSGNVWEGELIGADELNRRCLEHCVMLLADEASVLDGLGHNVVDVRANTDDPDIIRMRLEGVQRDVFERARVVRCKVGQGRKGSVRCPIKNRMPIRLM
jgi:hypothetical protein